MFTVLVYLQITQTTLTKKIIFEIVSCASRLKFFKLFSCTTVEIALTKKKIKRLKILLAFKSLQ